MRSICCFLAFILASATAFCQGTLRGKIIDENGETIIGASVVLKSNPGYGTVTDFDGNYSFNVLDSTRQIIIISFISFRQIEDTIELKNGKVLIRNYTMVSSAKEIKEVEIAAKALKARDYYVETMKKNSSVTIDYISSETIRKTGDATAVAAVTRVSGVSTNGGFITVRGIGDRYLKTGINGSRIPTLDPFTNNIRLDLFPSSLIDNIILTKTATPDLPADWAGAYLSIETKDYPDQLSVNIESSVGYNAQTSFRNILTSARSSTDWLGFDSNLRDRNHGDFVLANMNPSPYQEMVALGLGSYYNSLGVNGNNWGEGTTTGDTYFKLGLIQLGLLAPGLIDDPAAFESAKELYQSGGYRKTAFQSINARVPEYSKSFANNWNTQRRIAPLNFSQSLSIGNQKKLFGKDVGFLVGLRYSTSIQFDPNSVANRASVAANSNGELIDAVSSAITQEITRENNGFSGLINASVKLNANNSVSFLFMPNQNGVNNVRSSIDTNEPALFIVTKSQFYEQRKQFIYQLKSEHYIPRLRSRIEFNTSFTDAESKAPDFKNVQYYKDPFTNAFQIGGAIGDGIHRYYRYLTDDVYESRLSMEIPFKDVPGLVRKIKVGGLYEYNYRKSDQYDYFINFGQFSLLRLTSDDLEQFFVPGNFDMRDFTDDAGYATSTLDMFYSRINTPANFTFGRREVISGFVMADYSINPLIRLSGGVRIEQSSLFTDVDKFDSIGYAKNDPRREYVIGLPLANPGSLDELYFLPSFNFIYKIKPDETDPLNLRLNYSQTIARPSLRELSDVAIPDFELRSFVFGNSELRTVKVTNYDIRLEKFFRSGENVSVSGFYKQFKDHIELVKSSGYSWQNVDNSSVYGVELEGVKKLNNHFDFRTNLTFIYSRTEFVRTRMEVSDGVRVFIPQDTVRRPMFGQAPYVLNAMLNYNHEKLGLNAAVSYNVQGSRLVIAADVKEIPDIYELARHLVDFKVSKNLMKHFTASITVRDILNQPIRRSYKYEEGYKLDYDRFTYGTNYVFSIAYRL